MQGPLISVVMGVYNGEKYLCEAIDSILGQTYEDFEFLIVDDGSTDRTLDIIKTYDDPRIRLIRNEKNLGLIKTLNKGISESCGKYIARMDADDISLPDRFRLQVEFLEANPLVAVVGGQFSYIDGYGKIFAQENVPTNNDIIQKQLLKINCFAHPTVMINTTVLKEVGGYSAKALHAEDYELWLRIADNHHVENLAEIILLYRVHLNQISLTKLKPQVDMARQCRRNAIERRFPLAKQHEAYPHVLSFFDQLRGFPGSYGMAYSYWSTIYEKMGADHESIEMAKYAFISSPLSLQLAKRLLRLVLSKKLFY